MSTPEACDIYDRVWATSRRDGLAHALAQWTDWPSDVDSVLDAGCGLGALAEEMTQEGQLYGIDASPGAIESIIPTRAERYERLAAHDLTLGVPPDWPQADMVFCADVLEHIEESDLRAFWDNCLSLVRPNGWATLTVATVPSRLVVEGYGNVHRTLWPHKRWLKWLVQTIEPTLASKGLKVVFMQGRVRPPEERWIERPLPRGVPTPQGT